MNAGQRSARRLASRSAPSSESICTSCLLRLSIQPRRYASAAVAEVERPTLDPSSQHIPPVTASAPRKAYRILASPVISRPPVLTRQLTDFEKAFYLYQKRLNERLALPFSRYFYFKKANPADLEWKRKARGRKSAARDIGVYSGYGDEAWNDEVLVGDVTAEPDNMREALLRDAAGQTIIEAEKVTDAEPGSDAVAEDAAALEVARQDLESRIDRPMPRATEADEKNDVKSLNRKLDRSLYLLLRNKEGRWRFPEDRLHARENLHQAAERIIVQAGGLNMNTWVVGNHPIGHFQFEFPKLQIQDIPYQKPDVEGENKIVTYRREEYGEKVFFMKSRIMAGQADLAKNTFDDQDFQWLAKEEIAEKVTPKYWQSIKNMLVER
ncbi:hypothetical protein B0A48_16246 [Cryoendolithus antarcticus]|uniref:Large ribosomal subunit protein mL46 n=1 Tax=Cryoendolithus antarcticus TaxID=1507870 RepID=A0A1V8SFK6_9PEZI|nr:hypothetical protein B0A48_16246 [Cryoendolithus antarcticus]